MVLLHLVDTFAERPFTGNPAAVCLLDGPKSAEWMQQLAFELGFAETAYVLRTEEGLSLRWFTPLIEVSLCGHATMASAHVLWSIGRAHGPINFHTQSGVLTCERKGRLIYLDLPRIDPVDAPPPIGLFAALGLRPVSVRRADGDFLLEVQDEDIVRRAAPDMRNLTQVNMRGVAITAPSKNPEFDFVSRFFAPQAGINEDPVTGSAHSRLVPYWAKRLGKTVLFARQASARGGELWCELRGERVTMAGHAALYLEGTIEV